MHKLNIATVITRITVIISVAELLIMIFLENIPGELGIYQKIFLDVFLLVTLSTPIIFTWVIKPYVIVRDEAVAKLTHMAFHDALTQLPNRNLLSEHICKMIANINRHGICGALLLIDLDGFKKINDNNGHNAGDVVLVEVARRLLSIIRTEDIASRLGGDEFVILLNQLDADGHIAQKSALQFAARVQGILNDPIDYEGSALQIGSCIGLRILLPDNTLDVDTAIKDADIAMYRAKQKGKGNIVVYKK